MPKSKAKSKAKEEEKNINIFKNKLVPDCKILNEKEREELFEKYNISKFQLPSILAKDPLVKSIGAKKGDILKIMRKKNIFSEDSEYYRLVIGGSN